MEVVVAAAVVVEEAGRVGPASSSGGSAWPGAYSLLILIQSKVIKPNDTVANHLKRAT